ncbi:MAG: helix-turn-helix transcriptional regulator [Ktedonobacterales bacterium]
MLQYAILQNAVLHWSSDSAISGKGKTVNKTHPGRDPLILTILAMLAEQPRHPYEIQRLIRERRKDFARSTQRALYHAINRLVDAGLIVSAEVRREGNRPERTVYQITDDGRDSLMEWLGELLAQPTPEYPLFTVAISFIACLPMETAIAALHARAIELEGELAGIDARLQALEENLHRLVLLELEYVRALRQGELAWVRSLLQDMRNGRLAWDADAILAHPVSDFITAESVTRAEATLRLLEQQTEQTP